MIQHNRQQQLVVWVIWGFLLCSVVVYQFALGGGIPKGTDAPAAGLDPFAVVAVVEVLIASAIRWLLLPRADAPGKILVLMIIGLALSEAAEILGLFLVSPDQPGTKLALWILSLLSVIQFIPLYARSTPQSDPFRTN